jgi:protein TonB
MNPDYILRADVLDIIFENRNKEYGAYELRKRYHKRLKYAMGIMLATVAMLWTILYLDSRIFHGRINRQIFQPATGEVDLSKTTDVKKQDIIKPRIPAGPQRIATFRNVAPMIVSSNQPTKPLPQVTDIDLKKIGTQATAGVSAVGDLPLGGPGNGADKTADEKTGSAETGVLITADFMPEFPGGMEVLKRFLARNIHMPAVDPEPGSRIRVLAKFVVDEQGNISRIQTIQSGGASFDDEVLRVLNKMPRWKPGRQNGRNVAVYFTLPVIFQSQGDD